MKREAPSCSEDDNDEQEQEQEQEECKSVLGALLQDPRGRHRRRALETRDWTGVVGAADVHALCAAARTDASDDVRAGAAALLLRLARAGRLGTDAALQSAVFAALCAVVVADPVRDARAAACAALGALPAVPDAVVLRALSKSPLPAAVAAAVDAREASLPACALATGDIDLPRLEAAVVALADHHHALPATTGPKKEKGVGEGEMGGCEEVCEEEEEELDFLPFSSSSSSSSPSSSSPQAVAGEGARLRLLSGTGCVGAGALVHAVEDECAAVRRAAVGALAAAGLRGAGVAARAVECLADVLTDGIDGVRVAAVGALARVTARTPLATDALHAALAMLEEPAARARAAVRRLLGAAVLPDAAAAHAAVQALLRSLARHPADARAAYRTLRRLGAHNAALVAAVAPALLRADDARFEPVEPVADDPLYVGAAVAVLAAAAARPPLVARLPRFLLAHASLLHHRYPRLIPARFAALSVPAVIADYVARNGPLPVAPAAPTTRANTVDGPARMDVSDDGAEEAAAAGAAGTQPLDAEQFMAETLAFAYDQGGQRATRRQLQQCVRRLRACETLLRTGGCAARAEHARFHARFLQCVLAVAALHTQSDAARAHTLAHVFQTTYALEHACAAPAALPPATLLALRELRLVAHAAYVQHRTGDTHGDADLARRAERVREYAGAHGLACCAALPATAADSAVAFFPAAPPALPADLARVRVRFESPECNRDRALSWNTAFPLELACRIASSVPLRGRRVFVRAVLCFDSPLVAVRPQLFPCTPAPHDRTAEEYECYFNDDEEEMVEKEDEEDEDEDTGCTTQTVVISVEYPQVAADVAPHAACTHIELSVVAAFATECAVPDLCFDAAAMHADVPGCPECNAAVPLTAAPHLFYVFPKVPQRR